jgi:hypothetical protein
MGIPQCLDLPAWSSEDPGTTPNSPVNPNRGPGLLRIQVSRVREYPDVYRDSPERPEIRPEILKGPD